jgi:UDP-glucuronate 4-epimerase
MKILVTGAAGFIGFHTCLKLVNLGYEVYGIDNINDYYNPKLKFNRLIELGFNEAETNIFKNKVQSAKFQSLYFSRLDLVDNEGLVSLFKKEKFDVVCNLAAQAGVRYSLENPRAYIDSNVVGFLNILECSRHNKIKHFLYASSSSVYGKNKKVPFSTSDVVDNPISLYAATKKSNELMAHTYSHLYNIPTTGMRFFTVYGPWGRPDMAYMLFADAISNGDPIKIFNNGNMSRDFTYIDDIIKGIEIVLKNPPKNQKNIAPYKVLNIGNGKPQSLHTFIDIIEVAIDKKAKKEFLPIQDGDVEQTWADITELEKLGYNSSTDIYKGISSFINWYINYKEKLDKQ